MFLSPQAVGESSAIVTQQSVEEPKTECETRLLCELEKHKQTCDDVYGA